MNETTYRILIPFLAKVKEVSVNDKKHIDNDQKVMGVPKGIETSKIVEGFRQLNQASPEPRGGQSEGYCH